MTALTDFIALNRFGLGYSASDQAAITRSGAAQWLEAQIRPGVGLCDMDLPSQAQLVANIARLREAKGNKDAKKDVTRDLRQITLRALEARFGNGMATPTPFAERLALFWSNHFTVSLKSKPIMGPLACDFERAAIRPHLFGTFADMALASTRHPAMLIYLDNAQSIGPNSRAGQRRGRGLNENLARELMELHTLGVGGGYTQADVTEMAKILTGWTVSPPDTNTNGFAFSERLHEPGAHTVMGRSYPDNGEQQGIAAIRDLTAHPATAAHIATKLARHFTADDPPPALIAALADAFQRSGGDLPTVYRALIARPEVWRDPLPKVKTPYELLLSSFRLIGVRANQVPFKRTASALALMDHQPFAALSPAGWPDKAEDWLSPSALMTRIEWCHALAQKIPAGSLPDPSALARACIGPAARPGTLEWIARAPSPADGYALVLASAEFQRR